MFEKLYLNTYDPGAAALAHQHGLGLEVDSYLWPLSDDELSQVHKSVRAMIEGVSRLVMHGPIISSDLDVLAALDPQEVRRTYEQVFASARLHQINRIVFHSGFVPGRHEDASWLESAVSFWRCFLADKGDELTIYIENMVDDDPLLLAALCDRVADDRFRLCLDVGHAHCNSSAPVAAWIAMLSRRIGHVHLHNNDGLRDRHWPLCRGTLDMGVVLQQLQSGAPDATYTLECDFAPSLEWLLNRQA